MSTQTKESSGADSFILFVAFAVLIAGIVGFYYFEEQVLVLRVVGLIAATVLSVVVAVQSVKGKNIWAVIRGSRTEVRKVVWPTRQETIQTTLIVFIVVLILGVFLWLGDMGLLKAVQLLTGQEVD